MTSTLKGRVVERSMKGDFKMAGSQRGRKLAKDLTIAPSISPQKEANSDRPNHRLKNEELQNIFSPLSRKFYKN